MKLKEQKMERCEMTDLQIGSLTRKWGESNQGKTLDEFLDSATPLLGGGGCVMVEWCGMFLGVETDGRVGS